MNFDFLKIACLSSPVAIAAVGMFSVAQPAAAATFNFQALDLSSTPQATVDVTLSDIVGGIQLSLNVIKPTGGGDIVAVYLDFTQASGLKSFAANAFSSLDPIVTGFGVDTSDVQSGNIGKMFDLGIKIGGPGAGKGDFYSNITFDLKAAGLDVSDLTGETFAVRVQSLGGSGGSAKAYGEVPTPALLPGLVGLGVATLRRKQENEVAEEV